MKPAIFLDRDGVLIENKSNYIRSWNDVKFFSDAVQALVKIRDSSFRIVIVTNQSAVGRGIISLETAYAINNRIVNYIENNNGRIDSVFMCPHAPEDQCECRKPKPGLFYQAANILSLDLEKSIMIGDALSDIIAAQAAGVKTNVLVKTGRGKDQLLLPEARRLPAFLVYDTLGAALENLI